MSNLLLNVPPQKGQETGTTNGKGNGDVVNGGNNNRSNSNNSHKSKKGSNSSIDSSSSSGGTDDHAYELRVAEMSLRGMGFPQQDVLAALAKHGPDQTRCIEHLLTLTSSNSSSPSNSDPTSAAPTTADKKSTGKATGTPPLPGTTQPSSTYWTTEPLVKSKRAAAVVAAQALISTNQNPLKYQPTPILPLPRIQAPAAGGDFGAKTDEGISSPASPSAKRSKQSSPSLASTSYVQPPEQPAGSSDSKNGRSSDNDAPLGIPPVELFPCQLCSTGIEAELLLICDGNDHTF
jgi:hypothetical protein